MGLSLLARLKTTRGRQAIYARLYELFMYECLSLSAAAHAYFTAG
jgi:hypothetical protein